MLDLLYRGINNRNWEGVNVGQRDTLDAICRHFFASSYNN
jgi:hypothetical protein